MIGVCTAAAADALPHVLAELRAARDSGNELQALILEDRLNRLLEDVVWN